VPPVQSSTSGPHLVAAPLALILAALTGGLLATPVINEIHYNNDRNTIANEFVELYNPGPGEADVSGWQLTGGIEFTIPSLTTMLVGDFLVVAQRPATVDSLYGTDSLGPYVGGLSGEGETIDLVDASGVRIDRVNFGVDFPWPTAADGTGSSMELINATLDNNLGSSWRSSSTAGVLGPPTAGSVNSTASAVAPPNIRQVMHTPEQPTDSEPTVITAKVSDPEGVRSVQLEFRLVAPGAYVPAYLAKSHSALLSNPTSPRTPNPAYETNWVTAAMLDDGLGLDAVAGDEIYTATIAAQPNRTLIRYRIEVTDIPGESITVPYFDDESLNFASFVYNGIPDYLAAARSFSGATPYIHTAANLETLPGYHLLTTQADFDQCVAYGGTKIPSNNFDARSEFNWSGTFVYNGVAYDNIKYRLRQRNARYSGAGKRSFRFRFNRGNFVQFHDLWGNPYPTKWRTLNSHKMSARGGTNFGLYEAINAILWNLTGTPAPHTHWFHFRVVKGAVEAPRGGNGQYYGDFYGLLLGMEDYDRRFLKAHNLEDGNLYKLKSYVLNGLEVLRYQAPNAVPNGSDYSNIINNLRPQQSDAWLNRNVDWNSWYHYHAIVDAVRHYDVQPNTGEHLKNRSFYFKPHPGSRYGLLNVLPWDSDTSWGPNWNGGVGFVKNAMGARASYNLEYRNVVREIRDLVWQQDQIGDLISVLEDQIEVFQRADRDRWTSAPASAGSQTDGIVRTRSRDMSLFAFRGGRWTGGDSGSMAAISRDGGISGTQGRDAYLDALAADTAIPDTPTLSDLSSPGYPANGLIFSSSPFSDSSGSFAAMEYRIAEYARYPGDKLPFPLEWSASWESGELPAFTPTIVPPASAVRGGKTYRARVRHKDSTGRWSHWSAPLEFTATNPDASALQQSLVISEIMYNPTGPDDLEFIELTNIGIAPLDLTNVRFTKGIDFDFAADTMIDPGEFLLVVKNTAAFEAEYGAGLPIAGEYQFEAENSLSNGGERIKLSLGAFAIHDFTYDNQVPWPTAADGAGYSLVLAHTSDNAAADPLDPLGHGIASNWRSSALPAGTAGAIVTRSFPGPDPAADDDGDGLNAFLEHAIGGNDRDPASGPGLFSATRDGEILTFTFQRDLLADDASYLVEVSQDLVNWSPDATLLSEVSNGDGTSTVTFKADTPIGDNEALFMRLRTDQVVPLE
jgi:hypothetical protein